jgi:hypothetical protein
MPPRGMQGVILAVADLSLCAAMTAISTDSCSAPCTNNPMFEAVTLMMAKCSTSSPTAAAAVTLTVPPPPSGAAAGRATAALVTVLAVAVAVVLAF